MFSSPMKTNTSIILVLTIRSLIYRTSYQDLFQLQSTKLSTFHKRIGVYLSFNLRTRDLFLESPEKFSSLKSLVVKLQSACSQKLMFCHVSNVRKKNKCTAKFYGLAPRVCEDIKENVAPEISGPLSNRPPGIDCTYFRTFIKTKRTSYYNVHF